MKEASKITLADGCYVDDGNNVAGADDEGGKAGLDDPQNQSVIQTRGS